MSDILRVQYDRAYQGQVDAAGNLTVVIASDEPVNWVLTQVSIEMFTAPAGASCVLRHNGSFVSFLIATGDAAGGDPPLVLRPGERATVEWSSCTPGHIGRVLVFYDRIAFAGGFGSSRR